MANIMLSNPYFYITVCILVYQIANISKGIDTCVHSFASFGFEIWLAHNHIKTYTNH